MSVTRYALCLIFFLAILALPSSSKVYFKEDFTEPGWETRWTVPTLHGEAYYGKFEVSPGKWYGDKVLDAGLLTIEENKHYHIIAPFKTPFNFSDPETKNLIVQYSVKFEETSLSCVGAYLKLGTPETLPSSLTSFSESTRYNLMFGPDVCGSKDRIRFSMRVRNRMRKWKRDAVPNTDRFTHFYTLWLKSDDPPSYEIWIDGKIVMKGLLKRHFKMPKVTKNVYDKTDKKPEDWVDEKWMFVETEGDDGTIVKKKVKNPDYKGKWRPRRLPNPNYETEKKYYLRVLQWLAIEVWAVKPGVLFDNFLITDDVDLARSEIDSVLSRKDREKAMNDAHKADRNAQNAATREKNLERQKKEREERERGREDRERREAEEKRLYEERIRKKAEAEERERRRVQEELRKQKRVKNEL